MDSYNQSLDSSVANSVDDSAVFDARADHATRGTKLIAPLTDESKKYLVLDLDETVVYARVDRCMLALIWMVC